MTYVTMHGVLVHFHSRVVAMGVIIAAAYVTSLSSPMRNDGSIALTTPQSIGAVLCGSIFARVIESAVRLHYWQREQVTFGVVSPCFVDADKERLYRQMMFVESYPMTTGFVVVMIALVLVVGGVQPTDWQGTHSMVGVLCVLLIVRAVLHQQKNQHSAQAIFSWVTVGLCALRQALCVRKWLAQGPQLDTQVQLSLDALLTVLLCLLMQQAAILPKQRILAFATLLGSSCSAPWPTFSILTASLLFGQLFSYHQEVSARFEFLSRDYPISVQYSRITTGLDNKEELEFRVQRSNTCIPRTCAEAHTPCVDVLQTNTAIVLFCGCRRCASLSTHIIW